MAPAPPPVAVNPYVIQAISAQLRKAAGGKLRPVYAARNFAPLWAASGNIGPEAGVLIGFLNTAELDGLRPSSYKVQDLQKAIDEARGGEPKKIARAEVQLSKALSHYAVDLRKPPKRDTSGMVYADPALRPQKPREGAALRGGALATSFPDLHCQHGLDEPSLSAHAHADVAGAGAGQADGFHRPHSPQS